VAAQTAILRQSLDGANLALGSGVMYMLSSSVSTRGRNLPHRSFPSAFNQHQPRKRRLIQSFIKNQQPIAALLCMRANHKARQDPPRSSRIRLRMPFFPAGLPPCPIPRYFANGLPVRSSGTSTGPVIWLLLAIPTCFFTARSGSYLLYRIPARPQYSRSRIVAAPTRPLGLGPPAP